MVVLQEIVDLRSNPEVYILQGEDAMVDVNGIKKPIITTELLGVQV